MASARRLLGEHRRIGCFKSGMACRRGNVARRAVRAEAPSQSGSSVVTNPQRRLVRCRLTFVSTASKGIVGKPSFVWPRIDHDGAGLCTGYVVTGTKIPAVVNNQAVREIVGLRTGFIRRAVPSPAGATPRSIALARVPAGQRRRARRTGGADERLDSPSRSTGRKLRRGFPRATSEPQRGLALRAGSITSAEGYSYTPPTR